jgi:hypothetical protein
MLTFVACGPAAPPVTTLSVGNDGGEVEVSHAGLRTFVTSGAYRDWSAEPAVRDAIRGSPHGKVRVYFNKASYDALKADAVPLPVGSMIVKDLFNADGATVYGYAVMVKTSETSWTWWEAFTSNFDSPASFGVDTPVCTGCHSGSGNKDQVLTPVP